MKKIICIPETGKVCPIVSIQYVNHGHCRYHNVSRSWLRLEMVEIDGDEFPIATFIHGDKEQTYQFELNTLRNIGNVEMWYFDEQTKTWPKKSKIVFIRGDNRSTLAYYPNGDFNRFYVYTIVGNLHYYDFTPSISAYIN